MNAQTLSTATAVISILCFVGVFLLIWAKKDPKSAEKAIDAAEAGVEAAQPLVAGTPLAPVLNVTDEILKAAHTGVHSAEQLYVAGQPIDRKAHATKYVVNVLHVLGVEVTPQLAAIVDDAVESAVNLLPPTKVKTAAQN